MAICEKLELLSLSSLLAALNTLAFYLSLKRTKAKTVLSCETAVNSETILSWKLQTKWKNH